MEWGGVPKIGVRLPRVAGGIVAGPANEEVELLSVVERSTMGEDGVNYILVCIKKA
jgi:hypothetical protein